MPANSSLFKPWPEYRTKSLLFKPSVTQPISQTPYDLNNELLVRYSGHGLNNELLVRYSGHGLNNEPFGNRTILDHLNTELVRYSDPHCTGFKWHGFSPAPNWYPYFEQCNKLDHLILNDQCKSSFKANFAFQNLTLKHVIKYSDSNTKYFFKLSHIIFLLD